uniref:Uncharacterized protein n=1 Tax=Sicyonia whispovirus TaxID=2984283 RepID=A0A9C7F8F4_9VIRU|nr:MAG: hypothetical protein [Sicyonia whispovirus]
MPVLACTYSQHCNIAVSCARQVHCCNCQHFNIPARQCIRLFTVQLCPHYQKIKIAKTPKFVCIFFYLPLPSIKKNMKTKLKTPNAKNNRQTKNTSSKTNHTVAPGRWMSEGCWCGMKIVCFSLDCI